MLKLTNTLSHQKESFVAIEEQKKSVGMYSCGPTVYDYPHIGNLRKYIFDDILRRTLEFGGYTVHHVINITDFGHLSDDADAGEDKMTKGLLREGKPLTMAAMKELADFYASAFKNDIEKLNVELPEVMPKASEHVDEDISLIQRLESRGFIYKTSDGLYFDTSKFPQYGVLGGINKDAAEDQSRIQINSEKKTPKDFAVWKFSAPDSTLGFQSPWGKGFPGWHIECSAMSLKYLGHTYDSGHFDSGTTQTIDIHTGGIDHISVHHNNEIAQSEAATGIPFVKYWLHENFLNIDNTKISKSLRNTYTLKDLENENISPLAYRYWLLTAKYSSPVNFTWDAVKGAQNAYERLVDSMRGLGTQTEIPADAAYIQKFTDFIEDDLDTPKALALVWELLKDSSIKDEVRRNTLLEFDKVLGLDLSKVQNKADFEIPENIQQLILEREESRKNKDFKKSDELRDKIIEFGFEIKDTESGTSISKK